MKDSKLKISLLLGTMCVFLTAGIVVQIKTVKSSSTTVGKTMVENELRDSVLRWKQKYDNAYEKLNAKEKELDSLREQVLTWNNDYTDLNSKLSQYNMLLGNTNLIGKGIIITLNDGDSNNKGIITDYIVHDGDLIEVVNALKNAGAEAISINGQRIVNTTAITCAGNIIKINGDKVGVPFEIKAIGLPNLLYGAATIPGGYLKILESYGIKVDVQKVEKDKIEIPRYEGIYKLNYASINE